jgi:type I restriction enzyme S subunit
MAKLSSSNGKKANVPKLRFPEFSEEWKASNIGEISTYIKGAPLSKADISETGTPFILYGELYTTYKEVATEIKRKTNCIVDKKYLSKIGDVVIPTSGETPEEIATATCVMTPNVILAGDLNIFRINDIDGRFFSYVINHKVNKDISRIAQGKSIVHIKGEEISKIQIKYPSDEEQQKILSFIKLLSLKIEKQEQLIDKLKKYKRGLINEILSERVKLSADKWITCRIGDFLCPKSVKQLPSEDAPLMAFTSTSGVCEKGERYDRGFLVKDVTTKMYKRTDYGDFIYSSNNIDVGSIGLNLYGAAVISDVYEIFSIRYADPWFISETIQQKKVIHNILKYRQGCLYGQYRIYAEDFMSVHIRVPTLNIQKKIGSIFSQINRRITSEQNLLYWLEKIRASLLQQLFI